MNQLERIKILESKIQQLKEVLTRPYPYRILGHQIFVQRARVVAEFESAGSDYKYYMDLYPLELYAIPDVGVSIAGVVVFEDIVDRTIRVTGKGDAFKVLATVIEITKELVTNTNLIQDVIERIVGARIPEKEKDKVTAVEALVFEASAEEPSRVRLYDRIVRNTPGYTLVQKVDEAYILIKNGLDNDRQRKILKAIREELVG